MSQTDGRLLDLLAAHRVLTTKLAAEASGLSYRSTRPRLRRLHAAGLVGQDRHGVSVGSAPTHWWLTTAGLAWVGAAGRNRPAEQSGLFVQHTLAVAAFAIGLGRHGPTVGVRLAEWLRERDAWESWTRPFFGPEKLTPDGRADVIVEPTSPGGGEAEERLSLLVEIDRESTSVIALAGKVERYLTYAAYGGWQSKHERCPVLLVLTTSASRAARTLEKAAKARHRAPGPTDELLVGFSPTVDDPAAAILEPVWRHEPGQPARTLADLLRYRISTEHARPGTDWPNDPRSWAW